MHTSDGNPLTSLNGTAVDELTDPCVNNDGGDTVAVAELFGADVATATPAEEAAAEEAAAAAAEMPEAEVEVRACSDCDCDCAVSVSVAEFGFGFEGEERLFRRAGERRESRVAS